MTDDTRVHVSWAALVGDDTGGATILSYNLEQYVSGVWQELAGETNYYKETSFLCQTNIVAGQEYTFRIRARNKWGYGPYSDSS
jgi:hypothetical protein